MHVGLMHVSKYSGFLSNRLHPTVFSGKAHHWVSVDLVPSATENGMITGTSKISSLMPLFAALRVQCPVDVWGMPCASCDYLGSVKSSSSMSFSYARGEHTVRNVYTLLSPTWSSLFGESAAVRWAFSHNLGAVNIAPDKTWYVLAYVDLLNGKHPKLTFQTLAAFLNKAAFLISFHPVSVVVLRVTCVLQLACLQQVWAEYEFPCRSLNCEGVHAPCVLFVLKALSTQLIFRECM